MLNVSSLSAEALAAVLDQSVDCVKLIGLDGDVIWMNTNGLCAMEIDDFEMIRGRQWDTLWPEESRTLIAGAYPVADKGDVVRFDAFCPTAKGSPRWWNVTVSRVTSDGDVQSGYLAISRDITDAETGRQAMVIAAAELRHRLKNTYAMIGSLFQGFAKGNPEREDFAREMQSRLVALSAAQSLFSREDVPCEIATLIPALIEPFSTPTCAVTIDTLTDAALPQGQADALALVLGELAVNSAKHGALAHGGSVHLTTSLGIGALSIRWTEISNGEVGAHDRDGGQGLRLIQRIVRARKGMIDFDWQPDGLIVTLEFRLD